MTIKPLKLMTLAALALVLPLSAQAHRAWILPAATVLSSDDPWVTVDAAVSNDIFHTDYRAMGIDQLQVTAPDGQAISPQNVSQGKYRTVFDLQLVQKGTYKLFTASSGLTARWEDENGQRKFWPPRGTQPTEEGFKQDVPKKAKNLTVTQSSRRMETFVTAGAPNDTALQPTGHGLELQAVTHPNDLFAGEPAEFVFLIDGKPAAAAEITVIPGARRYRDSEEEITLKTDKDGKVAITWPRAGQYYLEASYQDDKAKKPAIQRRGSYTATFEVLPQ